LLSDFNRRAEESWIGKEVRVDYLRPGGLMLSCTLLAFEDGWLKIAGEDGEAWLSPAIPLVVALEGKKNG